VSALTVLSGHNINNYMEMTMIETKVFVERYQCKRNETKQLS